MVNKLKEENKIDMNEDLIRLIKKIKAKRKQDGYTVMHKSSNKYSLEEATARMIKSHLK